MIEVVVLCIGICWALYVHSTSTFNYWKRRSIAYAKPVPFLGNIKPVLTSQASLGECYQSIYNQFPDEPFVGIWLMRKPILLIRSPEVIEGVLVRNFKDFSGRGLDVDEKREPITANLVNMAGDRWKYVRQKLAPTFTPGKLRLMTDLLHKCEEALMQCVSQSLGTRECRIFEICELMGKYSTDVIGSVIFGLDLESFKSEDSPFRSMGHKVMYPSKLNAFIRLLIPGAKLLGVRTFPKDVNNFFENITTEVMELRKSKNIHRPDFMHLLMKIKEESSRPEAQQFEDKHFEFDDKVIAAQAFVFFAAGLESTSLTLSYCLYELALNAEIQSKAVQEIRKVIKKRGSLTYDSLQEMVYVENIFQETLRKYPHFTYLIRVCNQVTKIPGTEVELDAGTQVAVPVYGIHHDPQYYPNPETFNPERFTPENCKSIPDFTYLPFGDGPRICIGKRLANMEMKLCLARFLDKYQVTPCEKTVVPLQFQNHVILVPKGGIWLTVSRREDHS